VTSASLTLVPSWRLGSLLSEARDRHGRTVDRLAACTDRFTAADLIAIEAGERALDDRDLEAVVALYGIDPGALVPGRTDLVVDLDQHRLATAGYTQPLAGTAPTAEEVLASYLALVYTLRHAEPGTKVPLRQADLDVLARALALAEPDIEHRLVDLMVAPTAMVRERTLLLRARVLLPAAGVLLALTVGGAIVVSSRPDQPTPPARTTLVSSPPAGSTTNPSVQLGGAALQARDPDGTPGPVVVAGEGDVSTLPAGAVGVGDAQVAVHNPYGSVIQTNREGVASNPRAARPAP
jgi:hypothetical protein